MATEQIVQEIKDSLTLSFEEMKGMVEDKVTKEEMQRIDEKMDKLEDRLTAEFKKFNQPHKQETGIDSRESKAAFDRWIRKGTDGFATNEMGIFTKNGNSLLTDNKTKLTLEAKALYSNSNEEGGYLTGTEFIRELIKNITEFSPVRQYATVRTTSQASVKIPKRTGTFTAAWVAQQATRTETTGLKFGMEEIVANECTAEVYVGFSNLEDSLFNMEDLLSMEFAEQFGVLEGTAFISGTGVGQPFGILSATGLNEAASEDASLITATGYINAYHALKAPYINNGIWMMERATLRDTRKLVDGNGAYIWSPGLANNVPPTIHGNSYVTAEDMPTIGANTYPVLFGDFRAGYTIIDRVALDIIRDPYTQSGAGAVRFVARKRVGGQVVKPEALVKMKIAASV
jgi:HK97 family phage major capsid protein